MEAHLLISILLLIKIDGLPRAKIYNLLLMSFFWTLDSHIETPITMSSSLVSSTAKINNVCIHIPICTIKLAPI